MQLNSSIGEVLALFISQKGESERYEKEAIKLDDKGIIGDKFYAKDLERSVLLTTIESYNKALEYQIEMGYGMLGENILIDYNPYGMASGEQIQIGTVILEITKKCTICSHLSAVD